MRNLHPELKLLMSRLYSEIAKRRSEAFKAKQAPAV